MRTLLFGLAALALCASAAHAAEPTTATSQCELTCTYRQGDGPKRIVSCTERMDAKQCAAIADHKNLNAPTRRK